MSFFQASVVNKYIATFDKDIVNEAYKGFVSYFHDSDIQKNIRAAKEEQFQEGFLRELFVKVLDYTINPNTNYNLTTEFKNAKGSKKADGAILVDGKAIAVIELKGTNTTNLDKVNDQAFGYKNNQENCIYIITSNFEKLRFFIHNAVDHIEFNLFTLDREEFDLLWLCLNKASLLDGIPEKVKNESLIAEENITKKLYKDYADFKNDLWLDLIDGQRKTTHLTLYKKTQKLLDRFLFILFAEDSGLLPPNSISRIEERWKLLKDEDAYKPLYEIFKQYFNYINIGRKGKITQDDIFAYNGGLFYPDEILDQLALNDEMLLPHIKKLTAYNFKSEVDVNILGRIFENSLNDIDAIKSKIAGDLDKRKFSKRKKDGVFYTPSYITKYIVEDTLGRLCIDKKAELGIEDTDYTRGKTRRKKTIVKQLHYNLNTYRSWLLKLKICDPACGSGAFLNQALSFLITEHAYIDELESKLLESPLPLRNISNHILENNIFGVDVNEESVDIAKLSLWLRTAQRGRKLTSLNNNIKCGNSLISAKNVAEDKAFVWKKEFPDVFEEGGFDIVIGNPPYLRVQGLRENFEKESIFFEKNYQSATGRFDIYVLFIEKSYEIINNKGIVSFILPHKFLVSEFGSGIRHFLSNKKAVSSLIHFGSEMVFSDASTYTCIINLSKESTELKFKQIHPNDLFSNISFTDVQNSSLTHEKWNLQSIGATRIFDKLQLMPWTVKDVFKHISQGIVSVGDDIFLMEGDIRGNLFYGYSKRLGEKITLEADIVKLLLKGDDVKRNSPLSNTFYCLYPHHVVKGKTSPLEESVFEEKYPLAYKYMLPYKEELIEKKIRYKTNPTAWYSLHRSREMGLFEQEKIITPETSLGCNFCLDHDNYFHNTQVYSLILNSHIEEDYLFWMAILNSNVFWFFLKQTGTVLRGGYFRFKTKYLEPFPLPKLKNIDDQNIFLEKVNLAIDNTKQFLDLRNSFIEFLKSKFSIEKPSKKLQSWHDLEFTEFIKELNKTRKKSSETKLTKVEEMDWMEIFNEKKSKTLESKTIINQIDKEIDQMVYELYEFTDEEIQLIEST